MRLLSIHKELLTLSEVSEVGRCMRGSTRSFRSTAAVYFCPRRPKTDSTRLLSFNNAWRSFSVRCLGAADAESGC